jgi:hypothetical protein
VSGMICMPNRRFVLAKVAKLQNQNARRGAVLFRRIKTVLLGSVWLLGVGLTLAASPVSAQYYYVIRHQVPDYYGIKHRPPQRQAAHASKEPFAAMPKGPMQAIISIREQRLHFYRDGEHIADVPVATGVPGHLTPLGVFSVIQRDRYHHSNIYSNAPMPYMERITWSGVAMHEGPGVGHQASHGCIRMPHGFAAELWGLPTMGMRVIIAGPDLRPEDFADPHLFVHKDKPVPTAALPVETAQTSTGTKSDAANTASSSQTPNNAAANATKSDSATEAKTADPAPAVSANSTANNVAAPAAEPNKAAAAPADITAPIALDDVPLPLVKPEHIAKADAGPIAIFVSRKESKIYVRQNFMPLIQAPVKIEQPEQPLGTHVFTALDYMPDHSTLRWNVVSLPGEAPRTVERFKYVRTPWGERRRVRVEEHVAPALPVETSAEALARIDIPQDVIDQISQLIVPGSSLVVSDHGLGPETGSGTDFIVVTR